MLKGNVFNISDLSESDLNTMFLLMSDYYDNIKKEKFFSDFKSKNNVIVLRDKNNVIKGFSTIVFYDLKISSGTYKILFSGDTIIHKDYWAHNNLANVWLRFAIKKQQEFQEPLFWLLISKGYKTYKYLNTFFKTYYPNPTLKIPDLEQSIIDEFGRLFYPNNYDKKAGILRMNKEKDYLKEEIAKISEEKIKNDKVVKFFLEKNPEYYLGNELICITNLSTENVNKAGERLLGL